MKFLIVDDSTVSRGKIINVFKSVFDDIEYLEAADGEEALTYIDLYGSEIDLMTLDWHMPKKNGMEVLETLKKQNIKLAIIMLTTEQQKDEVVRAILMGASNYVVKPFDAVSLTEKAEKLLKEKGKVVKRKFKGKPGESEEKKD